MQLIVTEHGGYRLAAGELTVGRRPFVLAERSVLLGLDAVCALGSKSTLSLV